MLKKSLKSLVLLIASLCLFGVFAATNNNQSAHAAQIASFSTVNQTARSNFGKPYSWGATGPTSFDCSGFTQFVLASAGVNVPRTAQAQFNSAKHVKSRNIKAGDLVFFGRSKRSISHVGLAIGKKTMIDAQNRGVVKEKIHARWWHFVGASRPARMY